MVTRPALLTIALALIINLPVISGPGSIARAYRISGEGVVRIATAVPRSHSSICPNQVGAESRPKTGCTTYALPALSIRGFGSGGHR